MICDADIQVLERTVCRLMLDQRFSLLRWCTLAAFTMSCEVVDVIVYSWPIDNLAGPGFCSLLAQTAGVERHQSLLSEGRQYDDSISAENDAVVHLKTVMNRPVPLYVFWESQTYCS